MVVYPIELHYSEPEPPFWDEFCLSQSRARSLTCRARELNTESLSIPCSQHDTRLHARNWAFCFQRSPSERSKRRSSNLQWDPERSTARNSFRRAGCIYWSRSSNLHRLQGERKGDYILAGRRASYNEKFGPLVTELLPVGNFALIIATTSGTNNVR